MYTSENSHLLSIFNKLVGKNTPIKDIKEQITVLLVFRL